MNEFHGEGRKWEGASLPGLDAKKMILVLLREKNPTGAESDGDNGMDSFHIKAFISLFLISSYGGDTILSAV